MNFIIAIGLTAIVSIWLAVVIYQINKRKEINDAASLLDSLREKEQKMTLLFYERALLEKAGVSPEQAKTLIYAERVVLVLAFVASYVVLGFVGAGIAICIAIAVWMESKRQDIVESSGIANVTDTVSFLDFFVPSISSGKSAQQAFLEYINQLENTSPLKPLLIEYRNNKINNNLTYKVPDQIKDIVSMYENAAYNEEKGIDDYLYIMEEAREDLFQRQQYYNDYRNRTGEVLTPISVAYYVFVPVIIIMTMGSVGDFWQTIFGFVAVVILIILFFGFQYCINKLDTNTMKKIL